MASNLAISALLVLAMATHSSGAAWCVCKEGVDEKLLQKTIDYACGNGADCNPTKQGGGCFNPNGVKAHCSYAVNSYFQKKNQGPGTCDFAGTAVISQSDPSTAGCTYPASASAAGTTTNTPAGTTPAGGTTTVSPGSGTGMGGTSPLITTPTGAGSGVGVGGINNGGLGPSGSGGMNTDNNDSGGGSVAEMVKKNRPMMVLMSSFTAFLLLFWWV